MKQTKTQRKNDRKSQERTIPPHLADNLDKELSKQELLNTILQMNTNKAPGIDGIPVEFYKTFWTELQDIMSELAKEILENQNQLNNTQSTPIITLAHKDGPMDEFKNWQQIYLLCVEYKIITKTIGNILKIP